MKGAFCEPLDSLTDVAHGGARLTLEFQLRAKDNEILVHLIKFIQHQLQFDGKCSLHVF